MKHWVLYCQCGNTSSEEVEYKRGHLKGAREAFCVECGFLMRIINHSEVMIARKQERETNE